MTYLLRILFLVLVLPLFVAMNVYLYRRMVRDVTRSRLLRILAGATLALLYVSVPLERVAFRDAMPPVWISTAVLSWWGVLIYTLMALLVLEVAGWLFLRRKPAAAPPPAPEKTGPPAVSAQPEVNLERRLLLSRAAAAGALTLGAGVSSFGLSRAFMRPELTETVIRLPGLPKTLDGFTIVQLSDIHIGQVIQDRFVAQLVSMANEQKPDLLAITGDLVDGAPKMLGPVVALLRGVRSRHGTYFCSGNHDYYSGWERWAPALEGLDFTVLRNRHVSIGDAGGSFDLVGVDDWHGGYNLDAATVGRDPERPSVLLAHQPVNLEEVAKKQIGLQLSGHTHGGQIFPLALIGPAIYGQHFTGLSRTGNTWQYTSRGCGFVGPPMRIGSPPEIVKVVLVAA